MALDKTEIHDYLLNFTKDQKEQLYDVEIMFYLSISILIDAKSTEKSII